MGRDVALVVAVGLALACVSSSGAADEPEVAATHDKPDSAVPADASGPGAPVATPACAASFNWAEVPPVHVFPRPGFFPVPPSGPGYYSLADHFHGEWRKDRQKYGHAPFVLQPPSFFDVDFRYLDDPKTPPRDLIEGLHRVHLGDDWLFSTGGEFRWRYANERNSRLGGVHNTYDLLRTRVYGDLWYQDRFRAFVELLDARSYNEELPPALTDVDHADFLNAFIDVKIWDAANGNVYLRGGRQELLLGSQRLLSPPDWLNTRRTFNGVRGYYVGKKWDVDVFWAQPVVPDPSNLDSVDNNQNFAGAWVTHRPDKGQFRDFYYLFLDNTNNTVQQGIERAPFNIHTLGTRWAGDKNRWLYDFEGMLQFGERGAGDIFAAAGTAGVGRQLCAPLNPTVWLYYDFASGDQNPNAGDFHTFNQLFPFGHYYMGWLDLVARQNIHDVNAHLYLYPTKWITVNVQYHHFELASRKDALYNAGGNAIRRDPTGAAGRHVGDEIDLIVNFHLTRQSDLMVGYSHLWAGDFLEATGPGRDPELLFVMFNVRW
jgi:hypothetical protein